MGLIENKAVDAEAPFGAARLQGLRDQLGVREIHVGARRSVSTAVCVRARASVSVGVGWRVRVRAESARQTQFRLALAPSVRCCLRV